MSTSMLLVAMLLATFAPSLSTRRPNAVREREEVVRRWAPLVWLHPEEHFFPDSVPAFLAHVQPSLKIDGVGMMVNEGEATFLVPPLPVGPLSRNSFLKANHNFDCPACSLPKFLHGRKPDQHYTPPVYAVIHSCNPLPSTSTRDSRSVKRFQVEHSTLGNNSAEDEIKQAKGGEVQDSPQEQTELHYNTTVDRLQENNGTQIYNNSTNNNTASLNSEGYTKSEVNFDHIQTKFTPASSEQSNTAHTNSNITSLPQGHPSNWRELTFDGMNDQSAISAEKPDRTPVFTSISPMHNTNNDSRYASNQYTHRQGPTDHVVSKVDKVSTVPDSNHMYSTKESRVTNASPQPRTRYYDSEGEFTESNFNSQTTNPSLLMRNIQSKTEKLSRKEEESNTEAQPSATALKPGGERDLASENQLTEDTFQTPRELLQPDSENHRAIRNSQRFSKQIFTVTYWMFYPYNRGKAVCSSNLGYFLGRMVKARDKEGQCHGEEVTMGDHVGDWEHISIQFKDRTPTQMYVSTHTFGAYYTYDRQQHQFVYSGEDLREGIPFFPRHHPRTLDLVGSRPVLYSSKGSHGLWATTGVHRYNWMPLLQDEAGKGTAWKTWKHLNIVDLTDPHTVAQHSSWWGYEGRWGNPSTRCHLLMAGMCEVTKGPTGILSKRVNFPCSHSNP